MSMSDTNELFDDKKKKIKENNKQYLNRKQYACVKNENCFVFNFAIFSHFLSLRSFRNK